MNYFAPFMLQPHGQMHRLAPKTSNFKDFCCKTSRPPFPRDIRNYFDHTCMLGNTGSTTVCVATTRPPAAQALRSYTVRRDYSSLGCTGSTATMPCIRTCRLAARLLFVRSHWLYCAYVVHPDAPSRCSTYSPPSAVALHQPRRASRVLVSRSQRLCINHVCVMSACLPVAAAPHQLRGAPRVLVSRSHWLYFSNAMCREYSSLRHTGSTSTTPRVRAACRRLIRLCRATGCLGSLRGSSSTTSPMPCDRVPRLLMRLIVDYFACAVRPVVSAPHAARR
jgi:hypothetical protein